MPRPRKNYGLAPHPVIAACVERRHALGLTQREVGERSGLAPQYLSQMELGYVTPSLDTADRLLAALGLCLLVEEVT